MASTFTLKSEAYDGRYMQLTCTQEIDTANNKSIITWVLSSVGGTNNFYSTGPTAIYINGTNVYYKDRVNWDAKVFPAAKGSVSDTIEVAHTDDGSKTITVQLRTIIYYGASSLKVYTKNWELDPIPRGATFTSAPTYFYNGAMPTVNYTNPLGISVSKVEICIADSAGWYAYAPYREVSKTGTSYTFTAEDEKILSNKMPSNGNNLGVMFVIRTTTADGKVYSDGKPSEYMLVETADTLPSVLLSLSPSNPPSVPSSLAGEYIQGKTRVSGTITATPKYNATITKYAYIADGKHEWFDKDTFTTNTITSSGNVSVIAKATDSRDFTGETSQTKYFHPYSKPLVEPLNGVNAIQCYRSNERGERKGSSKSVWIKAKMSFYDLSARNGCTLEWRWRSTNGAWKDEWYTLIARTTSTDNGFDALVSGEFAPNESYVIQIRAKDDIGEYDIKDFEIPTQDVALHLGAGGKRVTVGDYCEGEDYTFRSAWKAKFDNGIYGTLHGTMSQELAGDVLAFAESCPQGFTPFFTGGSSTNVPATGNYQYASGFVHKRSDSQIAVFIISYFSGDLAINTYYDTAGGWLGWRYLKTTTS